ncbi:hypothetical protein [Endozoicomonas sp. SESOKO1]|uniref:hypothetical protein n=1 Tax=Endozoicomonas sp. SESOKO1 TaxID=2828742 RepID=UPI00214830EB|nr:hypothetical protein [Endozoicomonas sp. SESOKO1]
MNISPSSAFHPVVQGSLPQQTSASQVVRQIERSNITPRDLTKFLHDRTVRECHAIAGEFCTAANQDPDFNAETLKKQLKASGFDDIRKPSCEGSEKHQCITGLLQHVQEESLIVGEGVDGPEATKFCQLIRAPDSCLGRGSDWLINVMNENQLLQEAQSRLTFDMFPSVPLSFLCKDFPRCEGGTIDQTANHGADHQFPQQVPHYSPVNAAPSAPPAYDDVAGLQAAPGQPEMPARSRESERSEQQLARGLNVIASQLESYSLGPSGTGTAMENMAEILQRMSRQGAPSETKVASGERLTSLARQVWMPSVSVFCNGNVSTADISVNIVGNNQNIQPVVSASWVPLNKLPSAVQERLKLARKGVEPKGETKAPMIQVYLFASSERALEGTEFTVELNSTIMGKYVSNFCSQDSDNLIPICARLRMPKGLKQGADFHQATFALHTVPSWRGRENVSFSHGKGESSKTEKHNIGIQQVAPVLEAIGVDHKTAMSSAAGLAIPFGFSLLKQDESKFVRQVKLLEAESLPGANLSGTGHLYGGANLSGAGYVYGGGSTSGVGGQFGGQNKPDAGSLFGGSSLFDGLFGRSTLFGGRPNPGDKLRGGADKIGPGDSIRAGGGTTRGASLPTEVEPEVNQLRTSGINPLACTAEKEYTFTKKEAPKELYALVAGIVWVQTVTSLPGIETRGDLMQWIDKQKVDPENPILPGIL